MIRYLGGNTQKPKNYSRKKFICSCECPIYFDNEHLGTIMVKYEIEPNKKINKYTPNVNTHNPRWGTTYAYWGKFKRIVELSPILNKMNDDEFIVKISTFTRDNIQVPFICDIEINGTLNKQKYESIKIQQQRKGKLKKLKNG